MLRNLPKDETIANGIVSLESLEDRFLLLTNENGDTIRDIILTNTLYQGVYSKREMIYADYIQDYFHVKIYMSKSDLHIIQFFCFSMSLSEVKKYFKEYLEGYKQAQIKIYHHSKKEGFLFANQVSVKKAGNMTFFNASNDNRLYNLK